MNQSKSAREAAPFVFHPIGFIESCFKAKFGTPRQAGLVQKATAILHLDPKPNLQGALAGLENFSHLWLIFVFHANSNRSVRAKVHPPRLYGEKMGVFATRSPHRPNPIGLSLVKLEKLDHDKIYLSGIDVIDGTPVLDIKPYLIPTDACPSASIGWLEGAERIDLEVRFLPTTHAQLAQAEQEHPGFRSLLEESLRLDPRPRAYRKDSEENPRYRNTHAMYLFNYDIHFHIKAGVLTILKIKALLGQL